MSTQLRSMGTYIVVDSPGIQLSFEGVVQSADLATTYTLSSGGVTLPTLAAGNYTPDRLCEEIAKLLQQWIFESLVFAGPPVVTQPASASDVKMHCILTPAKGVNTTLAELFFGSLGSATVAGQQAHWKSATFQNTRDWAHLLGLLEEASFANRTIAAVLNDTTWEVTVPGLWQPRCIFTFLRSDRDTGDYPVVRDFFTRELRDGGVTGSPNGSPSYHREFTLVDQKTSLTGPCFIIGEFDSLAGDRKSINLRNPNTLLLNGMSEPGILASRIRDGMYVQIGHAVPWVIRVKSYAAGVISFYEKIPSFVPTPPDRCPVLGAPEAKALEFESIRNEALIVYESSPHTGEVLWTGGVYGYRSQGDLTLRPERRDRSHALYSIPFELVRHGKLNNAV